MYFSAEFQTFGKLLCYKEICKEFGIIQNKCVLFPFPFFHWGDCLL